nr:hypothetical protein [Euzebyales bacterium]
MSPPTAAGFRLPLTSPQVVADTTAVWWHPPPEGAGVGVVLAHGAGSRLDDPALVAVAAGLAGRGHPVLTFNFAYAEAGRRRP